MQKTNPVKRDSDGSTIRLDKEEAEHADLTASAKRVILVGEEGDTLRSLNTQELRLLKDILMQIQITNTYLEEIVGDKLTKIDIRR